MLLLNICCQEGDTPLHVAAKLGYMQLVNILLENNADHAAVKKVNPVKSRQYAPTSV